MNLGEVITTSDSGHNINDAQYVAIKHVCGQNWPYHFFSNKPHCNTWRRDKRVSLSIIMCIYTNCLNETEARQVKKAKILRI